MSQMSDEDKQNLIMELDVHRGEDRPWYGFQTMEPPISPSQEGRFESVRLSLRRGVHCKICLSNHCNIDRPLFFQYPLARRHCISHMMADLKYFKLQIFIILFHRARAEMLISPRALTLTTSQVLYLLTFWTKKNLIWLYSPVTNQMAKERLGTADLSWPSSL